MLVPVRSLVVLLVICSAAADAAAQDCRGYKPPPVTSKGIRPDTPITYHFHSNVPESVRSAIEAAFAQWEAADKASKLNISFTRSEGSGNVLLRVVDKSSFPDPDKNAGSFVKGFDAEGYVSGGVLNFTNNTNLLEQPYGFFIVTLHEIGHMHGLGDLNSTDGRSVMNQMRLKDDSGGGVRTAPSSCDSSQAVNASRNFGKGAYLDNGGTCPGFGCHGYDPFPQPCSSYNANDGWCYPDGTTTPENYPHSGFTPIAYIAPEVMIRTPSNGATISGSVVDVTVATRDDHRVMGVTYYVNGQWAFATVEHPFSWSVSNVAPGQYTIQAVAFDNLDLHTASATVTVTVVAASNDTLAAGQRIYPGGWLYSQNGSYGLHYQSADGNLVVYGPSGPIWASMAFASAGYAEMQGDGNLVTYNSNYAPYWATMTSVFSSYLRMHNDGSLIIHAPGGDVVCVVNNGC